LNSSNISEFERAIVEVNENRITKLLSDKSKLELVNTPISLRLGLSRLATFCQNSSRSNVRILVDAEYSNINPALSLLTLGLQKILNKNEPRIWNTVQAYLKGSTGAINNELAISEQLGYHYDTDLL
jgi:hypothetical protein